MRPTGALLTGLTLVASSAALQFRPHPNVIRNQLHSKQPGHTLEASPLGDDTTARQTPSAEARPQPPPAPVRLSAVPQAPAPAISPQLELQESHVDPQGRTLVVTRETSVYLPAATPTSALPPSPVDKAPRSTIAPRIALSEDGKQRPHILDTLRKLSFVGVLARWAVRRPTAAAWWMTALGVNTGWGATKWSFSAGWNAADWTLERIVIPLFAPFLIPFHLFVLVPLSVLTTILIMLRPVFILLSSATLLGFLLGIFGGFGSGVVGDWVQQRSQVLMESMSIPSTASLPGATGGGYLTGSMGQGIEGAPTVTRQKGMSWAEKPSASWGDEDSAASDVEDSPEGFLEEPLPSRSPLFAGRADPAPLRTGSYTSARGGRNASGLAKRRSTAESATSAAGASDSPVETTSSYSAPRERKGSLVSGSSGRSPRPGMPKKKVTFEGNPDDVKFQ